MVMRRLEQLRAGIVAGLIVFAAACNSDATGPSTPFNVEQSNQDFAAVQDAFDANLDVAADMSLVLPVLDAIAPSTRRFERVQIPSEPDVLSMARNARFNLEGGSSAQPLLPSDVLGKTFEWSDGEGAYVATERAGAPANGLRIIVYDRTQTPFVEVGHVDVTDESDAGADRLRVHMVKDGITRLDYTVEATVSTSSVSVNVAGYITDGVDRVDFDVTESASETASGATIVVDYSLSLAGQPLSVSLQSVINFGEEVSVDLTATFVNGANTLVLNMSQDGSGVVDGTVRWNGDVVMTITGDGESEPVFLGPGGEELTLAEAEAIAEMFELVQEGLFFLAANLAFLGAGLA